MSVKVLFFAQAATWVGRKKFERDMIEPIQLAEFLKWRELAGLDGRLKGVRFAVNREFANAETLIKDGDEVAILPPVSGG